MKQLKTDVLSQLLGSYFHQDWTDEFDSDDLALQTLVESEPKERLAVGVNEADAVLTQLLPDESLAALFTDQIGCYFDPRTQGMDYQQWLTRVREAFAAGSGVAARSSKAA